MQLLAFRAEQESDARVVAAKTAFGVDVEGKADRGFGRDRDGLGRDVLDGFGAVQRDLVAGAERGEASDGQVEHAEGGEAFEVLDDESLDESAASAVTSSYALEE